MDPELLQLLQRLASTEEPLSDEELSVAHDQIVSIAADIDPAMASDDDVEVLVEAHEWARRLSDEISNRAEAARARSERVAALRAEMGITEVVDEDEEESEAPAEEPPAEEPPAEPAPTQAAAEPPAPTQAAAPPPPAEPSRLPTISRLAARTPRNYRPRPTRKHGARLVASGDLPGISAGQEVEAEAWAECFMKKYGALRRVTSDGADGELVYAGRIEVEYPEDRKFFDGADEMTNERKINTVAGPQALAASGGVCGPVGVDYSVTTLAVADRPVRDALAQFGATRGGLRFILPHTLAQTTADGPSILWTQANDIALNSPATKPKAIYTCQPVQEVYVDAVTSIVQFGNFAARYFPEQVDQYLATVGAVHARVAESTLLEAIRAGSTAVTADRNLVGATRDILATIDRAAAAYRYRHRMSDNASLRLIYPEFVEDMIRTDLARQLPGDSGSGAERLAVADAEIARFFTVRNINVTGSLDSPTGMSGLPTSATAVQGFGVQGAGQLIPWPTVVQMYLFHEGAWMFLDGGTLDLGMVRDSTLNQTNNFQMFSETFEKAVFRGHESLSITMDLCPSGQTASTVDTSSVCPSGS